MKISGRINSADHWSLLFSRCPEVLLNGTPVEHVCMADDQSGVVEVMIYDGDRPKIIDDQFVMKTLRGKVEIIGPRPGGSVH